jgi:hypothetical protein
MGQVKDLYIHWNVGGDEFVGRTLSMLPILKSEFASSPVLFTADVPEANVIELQRVVYPMISEVVGQGSLLRHCLAQLVYHRTALMALDERHVVFQVIALFVYTTLMEPLIDHTVVMYPWQQGADEFEFTGVPPHVATLHEIRRVGEAQKSLVKEFLDGMDGLLNRRNIQGSVMTEDKLREIVMDATASLRNQVNTLETTGGMDAMAQAAERQTDARQKTSYQVYMHGGMLSMLPATWRFPTSGALHVWQLWNLGNRVEGTPPLKIIKANDVKFVNRLPLQDNEKRRPARKTLCDLKFLMTFIEDKIRAKGKWVEDHTFASVTQMYTEVADELVLRGDSLRANDGARRDGQLKWTTLVRTIQDKIRLERLQQ